MAQKRSKVSGPSPPVCVVGPAVHLKGELTAEEHLVIQGSVEGRIVHRNEVTIDKQGHVEGEVNGRRITVKGTVRGTLSAREVVFLEKTANVQGNVSGSHITLGAGASFSRVVLNGRIGRAIRP